MSARSKSTTRPDADLPVGAKPHPKAPVMVERPPTPRDQPFMTGSDAQDFIAAVRFQTGQMLKHEALFQKMVEYSMKHVEQAAQSNALLRQLIVEQSSGLAALVVEVKAERAELGNLFELFTGMKTNGGGDHKVEPPSGSYLRKDVP